MVLLVQHTFDSAFFVHFSPYNSTSCIPSLKCQFSTENIRLPYNVILDVSDRRVPLEFIITILILWKGSWCFGLSNPFSPLDIHIYNSNYNNDIDEVWEALFKVSWVIKSYFNSHHNLDNCLFSKLLREVTLIYWFKFFSHAILNLCYNGLHQCSYSFHSCLFAAFSH